MRAPATAGALLLRPPRRGADPGRGAGRESALARLPGAVGEAAAGTVAVHADLHNHSDLSDGMGQADDAFACMRAAGLDAAALTDHAGLVDYDMLEQIQEVVPWAGVPVSLLDDAGYARAGELADAFDDPGGFTAVRGFEWTTPHQGHVNVWFARDWTEVVDVDGMSSLWDWLAGPAPGPAALAGFNHPGRELLRFDGFELDDRLVDRVVSLELFNRDDDYLFEGHSAGRASPLLECLGAGWRPGLLGVSDEHGRRWGFEPGRGRAGLWLREWSREGLREALLARRFYATREPGLRVDLVAVVRGAGGARDTGPAGAPAAEPAAPQRPGAVARLGGTLVLEPGPGRHVVDLWVDVDGGPAWQGRDVELQVLTSGLTVPTVLVVAAARSGEPARVPVEVADPGGVPWLVLRVADPHARNLQPGPFGHPCNNRALAYASPIRLGVERPAG